MQLTKLENTTSWPHIHLAFPPRIWALPVATVLWFSIGHKVSNLGYRVQSISCFVVSHYNLGSSWSVLQQCFQFCWGMWSLKTILHFSQLSCHCRSIIMESIIWKSQTELCCCQSVPHNQQSDLPRRPRSWDTQPLGQLRETVVTNDLLRLSVRFPQTKAPKTGQSM